MIDVISGKQFPEKAIPEIEKATTSIDIIVYDWRWYGKDPGAICQRYNQAIIRAIRRKVKTRCILNNHLIATILKENGAEVRVIDRNRTIHCKLIIIDQKKAIIGSHNYTQRAFNVNMELSLMVDEQATLAKLLTFYNAVWIL